MTKPTQAAPQTTPTDAALSQLWLNGAARAEDFFAGPWRSFSQAAMESQKVLGEAVAGQLEVLQSAQEQLNHGYMNLLGCRKVQELPAAWASLSASCLDIAAAQAKAASTAADKLKNCYASLAQPAKEMPKA